MTIPHRPDQYTITGADTGPMARLAGLEPPAWMGDALCAEVDPEVWFQDAGGSVREAKAVCAKCTVTAECLDAALANNERYGIFGGLTERQRRRLRRPKQCPVCDQPVPPDSRGRPTRTYCSPECQKLTPNPIKEPA